MSRRRLSLDATTPEGRSYHEFVRDPRAHQPSECDSDSATREAADRDAYGEAFAHLEALVSAQEFERIARVAEADAAECRHQADAARRLEEELRKSAKAAALTTLSPQQLKIVRARVAIAAEGEEPSHHAVARRLGITPAAVSKQWQRIQAKLAAHDSAQVSTPAS